MSYETQLERMVDSGVLSEEQSQRLGNSLKKESTENKVREEHKKFPISLALLTVTLVVLLVVIITMGGGNETTQVVEDVRQTLNQSGGHGAMNSLTSGVFAIAIFLIIPILMFVYFYNGIVTKEEQVKESWAQVESNYQRRADLIPNLIETVSKYMNHESSTLENVTDARSHGVGDIVDALVSAQTEGAKLLSEVAGSVPTNDEFVASVDDVQHRVGSIMHRLLATVEAYPELRSSEQMMELQAQLEGTENRINVARVRFNESVAEFNRSIRVLPGSLIAGMGDFKRKAYFQSTSQAPEAVKVEFNK